MLGTFCFSKFLYCVIEGTIGFIQQRLRLSRVVKSEYCFFGLKNKENHLRQLNVDLCGIRSHKLNCARGVDVTHLPKNKEHLLFLTRVFFGASENLCPAFACVLLVFYWHLVTAGFWLNITAFVKIR